MALQKILSVSLFTAILSCTGQNGQKTETSTVTTQTEIPATDSGQQVRASGSETVPVDTPVSSVETETPQQHAENSKTDPAKNPVTSKTGNAKTTANSSKTSAPSTGSLQGRIGLTYIKEGEKKYFEEKQMSVHFKRITEDSRCPAGVNCIWEGVVVAEITFDGNETAPLTIKLASNSNAGGDYRHSVTYNGFIISLKSVAPNAVQNKDSMKGKYEIGLLYESAKKGKSDLDPAVIRSAPESER